MRTVADHLHEVLAVVEPVPPLAVALPDAVGCVLAADVAAPSDLPVTDLAAIDGYAVRSSEVEAASHEAVSLTVVDDVRAGATVHLTLPDQSCALIASGAPLPEGADAVLPLERTDRGTARVSVRHATRPGENVRTQGSEALSGEVVLRAGERIDSREIALAAALGRGRIDVHPRPRVVILPVGDELVEPGTPARSGQVYDANGHALATAVADVGAIPYRVGGVGDDYRELRELLEDQLVRADMVITTGGLSNGARDTVRDVVGPLGTVRFDDVAIAPGRRFGVGTVGEDHARTPILCLPGDPMAVQVAYEAFVRPALLQMMGRPNLFRRSVGAAAVGEWASEDGVREFVPVRVSGSPDAGYRFEVVERPHALSGLAVSNGLAVIPEATTTVRAGDEVACLLFGE